MKIFILKTQNISQHSTWDLCVHVCIGDEFLGEKNRETAHAYRHQNTKVKVKKK